MTISRCALAVSTDRKLNSISVRGLVCSRTTLGPFFVTELFGSCLGKIVERFHCVKFKKNVMLNQLKDHLITSNEDNR